MGVNDFVDVPHNTNLDPGTSSFTVEAWVKTATGGEVVGKYECGQTCISDVSNSLYELWIDNGKLFGRIRDTDAGGPDDMIGGQSLTGTTFIADGTFHHVALIRDLAAGQMRLYVDCGLDASAALNAGATGALKDDDGDPDPFVIGAVVQPGSFSKGGFFSGLIDEVKFYNRALSASEIAASAGECKGQADLLIKKGDEPDTAFALNDVYQTIPSGDQIETQIVGLGETTTFQVKVENDGDSAQTFQLLASESSESG
jgi:hypothetical protein